MTLSLTSQQLEKYFHNRAAYCHKYRELKMEHLVINEDLILPQNIIQFPFDSSNYRRSMESEGGVKLN